MDGSTSSDGTTPADPWIGKVVGGRYRLIAPLGSGGMGSVYRAQHTMMSKELAVKLLHPELGRIPEIAKRFLREAEAASRLAHPSCVTVTDFGRTDDATLFLVMEYVPGQSLTEAIEAGPMQPLRAVHIAHELLAGLAHAHAQGVVHRDLKPDNILIARRDGRGDVVKILDFGIAKVAHADGGGEVLTQAGVVFGTPEYLSPEQARGLPVDGRADLYAVGVILFEMLTGRRPFDAEEKVGIVLMHMNQTPPRPSALLRPGALPAGLDAVCLKAMAKEREERFADASEMFDALAMLELSEPARRTPWPLQPSTLPVAAGAVGGPLAAARSGEMIARGTPRPPEPRVFLTRATSVLRRAGSWLWPRQAPRGGPVRGIRARRVGGVAATCLCLFLVVRCGARGGAGDLRMRPPAITLPSPEIAAALRTAQEAIDSGNQAGARSILEGLESRYPKSGQVHYLLGSLLLSHGEKRAALSEMRQAIAADPGYRGDTALLAQVDALLDDREVGYAALDLLCSDVGLPALPTLVGLASTAKDSHVRVRAREAAARLGGNVDWVESYSLDLEEGASCAERRQAVAELRALGDKAAIPALRAARDRAGGFLGMSKYNDCIESDIVQALKSLEARP